MTAAQTGNYWADQWEQTKAAMSAARRAGQKVLHLVAAKDVTTAVSSERGKAVTMAAKKADSTDSRWVEHLVHWWAALTAASKDYHSVEPTD